MNDTTSGHDWRARLEALERRLKERGIRDIKFAWGSISETPLSHVAQDVVTALEAYLDGRINYEGGAVNEQQTLVQRLRDCVKVTFSAGLHGVETDCREAADKIERLEELVTTLAGQPECQHCRRLSVRRRTDLPVSQS